MRYFEPVTNQINYITFLGAVTEEQPPILKLTWLTERPVWIDQWPLRDEWLQKVQELVDEQLQAGHIVPSTSPWNTPVFTIPKKSGRWRLLHDLRAVNAVMQDMGALQPGLPSPTMIPKNWELLIIDLKDWFFTIKLHPEDCEKFAFTVPSVNKQAPAKRYHWVVLPQGMKNSPTICQTYVAWALIPLRRQYHDFLIYHYMDDILFAEKSLPDDILITITTVLQGRGLVIAPEKVQRQAPWNYLGWQITCSSIKPQKVILTSKIETLMDVQKLMGDIQWVQPVCGITNDDLASLMPLLGQATEANTVWRLSDFQKEALQRIMNKISSAVASRRIHDLPILFFILNSGPQNVYPFGIIGQLPEGQLHILEWIFLLYQPKKTL